MLENQVGWHHPALVQLVKQCLHNVPAERPTTDEVLDRLQRMKVEVEGEYGPSMIELDIARVKFARDMRKKDRKIEELTQQQVHYKKGFTAELIAKSFFFFFFFFFQERQRVELDRQYTELERHRMEQERQHTLHRAELQRQQDELERRRAEMEKQEAELEWQQAEVERKQTELEWRQVELERQQEELEVENKELEVSIGNYKTIRNASTGYTGERETKSRKNHS